MQLSDYGLETVADACARKGWSVKTVSNWVRLGELPAITVGTGRSAKYIVRTVDVDAMILRPRGRPKVNTDPEPKKARPRGRAG